MRNRTGSQGRAGGVRAPADSWRRRAGRAVVAIAVVSAGGVMLVGCAAGDGKGMRGLRPPGPPDVRFVPTSDNIVKIVKFFPKEPWLRFRHDIAPAVDGIKVGALFLIDGTTGRGMFGEGTIVVDLYRIDVDPQGYEIPTQVYQWTFDTEQAMPFRARKRTVQGWGYQLRLHWGDLDLAGREIELRISFRRLDGQVVHSSGQRFRVPAARARRRRPVTAVRGVVPAKASRPRPVPGRTPVAPATRPAPGPASRPAFRSPAGRP